MGRAYGEFCKRGRFWMFPASQSFVLGAGVALRGIQTCFVTCRNSFFVAGAILFATFSVDALHSSGQVQTLWRPPSSFCVVGAAL